MKDYLISLNIIVDVLNGRNLTNSFNYKIGYPTSDDINVSKIKDITYGSIRNYYRIQQFIQELVKINISLNIHVRAILLIGIYEIIYTKKPVFAVINNLVELTIIITKDVKAKNLVNAIFRNFLIKKDVIINKLARKPEYKYNFPNWLINKLKLDYPKQYRNIINNLNAKPALGIRVNKQKIDFNSYINLLSENKINYTIIEDRLVTELTNLSKLPLFDKGYVSIQDIHAQKLIDLIDIKTNDYILDACSAPGGKTCQILENFAVDMLSLDIDKERLTKVSQNLVRLNLKAKVICGDARNDLWWDKRKFDIIIADVPCSASGTIKHNPDIKLHRKINDIGDFNKLQQDIVLNLWHKLKPGGQMLYITCSIFKEENHDNIIAIQQQLSDMQIIKELSLLPSIYSDGFYYCKLQKQLN